MRYWVFGFSILLIIGKVGGIELRQDPALQIADVVVLLVLVGVAMLASRRFGKRPYYNWGRPWW